MDAASWVTAGATVVLVGVTAWYAALTKRISKAAGDSAKDAARAADAAERSATITAEQHLDEQLQRFKLGFNPITDELTVRNTSTTANWDRVVVTIVDHIEGPIAVLRDSKPDPSDETPWVEDVGKMEAGRIRTIGTMRWSGMGGTRRAGLALLELECWRGERSWPVQHEFYVSEPVDPRADQ
jgi:hypothetical protein